MGSFVLYGHWKSSCSWRVRAALVFKGLDYELVPVNVDRGEQHHEPYVNLNPTGMVPTLVHDGRALMDSMAIVEYLEEVFPDRPALLAREPHRNATIRSVSHYIASSIQPLQIPRIYGRSGRGEAFAREMVAYGLGVLEKRLKRTAGRYCVGDELTVADLFLAPQVYNALTKLGMHVDDYPTVSRVYNNLVEEPCLRDTHPTKQPDRATSRPLSPKRQLFQLPRCGSAEDDTYGKE